MSAWVQVGDDVRCERHGLTFGRLEVCAKCVDDPPILDDEDHEAVECPAPAGCLTTSQIEASFIRFSDICEQHAKAALADTEMNWHRYGAATKLIDSAIKSLRAASDLAKRRETEFAVESRMRRMKAMRSRARH